MKWSWKFGRIAGIDLRVHATFFILLAWWGVTYYRAFGVAGAVRGVLFTLALFASVVLHELGHALAARRFGVPTRHITLLPIGGVASLEYIPDKPKQELAIALAGPAVTLAIAVTIAAVLRVSGLSMSIPPDAIATGGGRELLAQLMWVNVSLLVFNLLPAFPMDGGRILRASLALRHDYLRATELAAAAGRVFAALFALIGLLYNPFLVLIAVFVWVGASVEAAETVERTLLSGVSVDRVLIRDVRTLDPADTLRMVLGYDLAGFQHDFPVVHGGAVVGLLTHAGLLQGLAQHGADSAVEKSMDRSFQAVEPEEPAARARARLRGRASRSLLAVHDGRLCGMLTADSLNEFVMIHTALRAVRRPPSRRPSLRANP